MTIRKHERDETDLMFGVLTVLIIVIFVILELAFI